MNKPLTYARGWSSALNPGGKPERLNRAGELDETQSLNGTPTVPFAAFAPVMAGGPLLDTRGLVPLPGTGAFCQPSATAYGPLKALSSMVNDVSRSETLASGLET